MKEFDRSIDASGLTLVDSVIFVIWQWECKEAADDLNTSDSDDEITVIPETSLDGSSDGKTDNEEQKLVQAAASISTHTVTFKCIRSTRDEQYEKTLMQVVKGVKLFHAPLSQSQTVLWTLRQLLSSAKWMEHGIQSWMPFPNMTWGKELGKRVARLNHLGKV